LPAVAERTVDVLRQQGVDDVVVPLFGELDMAVCPHIRCAGLAAVRSGAPTVTFDLHDARFVDAHALGALVEVQHAASEKGAVLRIVNVPARVLRVFELTGLTGPLGVTAEPA
jgi:anti-anti-sigma factor